MIRENSPVTITTVREYDVLNIYYVLAKTKSFLL